MTEKLYRSIPKKISFPKSSFITHLIVEPAFRVWFEFFDKRNLQEQDDNNKHKYINKKNFNNFIRRLINSKKANKAKFASLGFIPYIISSGIENWGRRNEKEFWLDITAFKSDDKKVIFMKFFIANAT